MTPLSLIKRAVVTEKSGMLRDLRKYVFLVDAGATKNEIKKAIKALYKVDPVSITTLNERPTKKRFRTKITMKRGDKKAIVTLKEGQKIDV